MLRNVAKTDPSIQDDRANMQQLIQLRWIAVAGQIITIAFVHFVFLINLPLARLSGVLGFLIAFNIFSELRWRTRRNSTSYPVSNDHLFLSLTVDVGVLTAQLYLSGGATNPFSFLYLLQVVLGAAMLRPWPLATLVALSSACFAWLTAYYQPLELPGDSPESLVRLYLQGTIVCYIISAVLLTLFITHIHRNQRARDARLADMRQRAAEEEHIVRMGLLASGAAHELSTPLSTLAVILGDWKHLPTLKADPDVLQEIDEMQTQVQRCKAIVTSILLSAGEARGEDPTETTVQTFLDELVAEWRQTRPVSSFAYENNFGEDVLIVADPAFKQTICNVLDNALEASPKWIGLKATRSADTLILSVTDDGPGFPAEMLDRLGKPYQSSKGRAGRGLGLFLVVNVVRTLGGTVAARNLSEGGAVVTLSLPLAAIQLDNNEASDNVG